MMNIIPTVKEMTVKDGICNAKSIKWNFADGTDIRVINAAKRICDAKDGISAYINHDNKESEEYSICISKDEIKIEAQSAAGAFYALSTLKMLISQGSGEVKCCDIKDYPDMKYRGFYQDATRGRIATLDTLKHLVDTMVDYKMNSLQLYVEHSFEFEEYKFCRDELGYLSVADIKELDEYCKERFVDLVPSLATFGHLYHLLQNEKYKHLCELENYEPTKHYWCERMGHHTINPLLDESFEVIKSLIDQHMAVFSSQYFNICCDETFDLGKGVNKGHDVSELYLGFVKKLSSYVESKGKTVMMWADIVLNYAEKLPEMSDKLVYLDWWYDKEIDDARVAKLKNHTRIVCPGTNSWFGFCERLDISEQNIVGMARCGKKYGAIGILNTNCGDLGNPATIEMAMYSLILGATMGWNTDCEIDDNFHRAVGEYHYGNPNAVDMLMRVGKASEKSNWIRLINEDGNSDDKSQEEYEKAQTECRAILDEIEKSEFINDEMKNEFIIAVSGQSLLIEWSSKQYGFNAPSNVNFENWLEKFKAKWLKDSKKGELDEMIKMLNQKAEKYQTKH